MLKVGSIDTCSFVVGQNWYYIRKDIIWEFFLLLKCRKTKWLRLQSLARKRSTFFICILSFFVKLSERPNADFSCFLAFINYHTFPFLMFWSWTLVYLFLANMHIEIIYRRRKLLLRNWVGISSSFIMGLSIWRLTWLQNQENKWLHSLQNLKARFLIIQGNLVLAWTTDQWEN